MKLTPSQRLMVEDGFPPSLFRTQAQRAAWWKANPPRAMPLFQLTPRNEDAATREFRARMEEERRQKSLASIARMKVRQASKAIDHNKMRWDARRGRFIEDIPVLAAEPVTNPTVHGGRRDRPNSGFDSRDGGQITKDNAEAIARLNGVWKDSYEKLRGTGRIVMTVKNVLKGKAARGEEIRWN